MKKTVIIGFLGTQLDYTGKGNNRWERWRPTVSLCQQEHLIVDRLILLHGSRSQSLANQVCNDIRQISPETEVTAQVMSLADPWDFEEVYTTLHDFARHYPFKPEEEDYYIHITTGTHVVQICWFLLTEAHYLPARLIQSFPINKDSSSLGGYTTIDLDLSRYNRIAQRFQREREETVSFLKSGIATRNPAFNTMIGQIEQVAGRSKAPILLNGPTGAGKSFLARRIHALKQQKQGLRGRFIEVNCATLRGESAMSTLFGHVKGAFTGAQSERPGLLRAAHGGLLFLDEIGELGLDEQAMLLKAVEEKSFFPFGGDQEVSSDFQLITGTHRKLQQWVAEGRFREDLYARINLWTFELPALAQRQEDIAPNLEFELERFTREHGTQVRFNVEARRQYLAFATSPEARWPGNFRELSASLTRMATLADAGRITEAIATDEIRRLQQSWHALPKAQMPTDRVCQILGQTAADQLDLFDSAQLEAVLAICHSSPTLSSAGRTLFAISRQEKKQSNDADRLRKYLARFGLDWEKLKAGENTQNLSWVNAPSQVSDSTH